MQVRRESSSVKVLAAKPGEPAFHPQNKDSKRRDQLPQVLLWLHMYARMANKRDFKKKKDDNSQSLLFTKATSSKRPLRTVL